MAAVASPSYPDDPSYDNLRLAAKFVSQSIYAARDQLTFIDNNDIISSKSGGSSFASSRLLTMRWSSLTPAATTGALLVSRVAAYIPAQPVNDTSGMNFSDSSTLRLKWHPRFFYQAPV